MVNEKLNFTKIALLIFLLILFLLLLGCSSAPKVAYCPNEHSILMEKINKDIRAINTCLVCGAKFPYLAERKEKKSGGYYFGYQPYYPWPRVWVYSYGTTRFHSYRHRHHHYYGH